MFIEKLANMAVGSVITLYILSEIGIVFSLVFILVIAAIEAASKQF